MILLPCPWCGPRDADEFHYAGEATSRPDAADATPEAWRDYLYLRHNPCGWTTETWYHRMGCRRYLTVRRHTLTNEVTEVANDLTGAAGGAAGAGGSGTAGRTAAAGVTAATGAEPAEVAGGDQTARPRSVTGEASQ